jgi:hypothetical protein
MCPEHRPTDLSPAALHALTRRQFFSECGVGVGKIALASLLCREAAAATPTRAMLPAAPKFVPRAKHVIYLFMSGAPSQLDLYDNKPLLTRFDGKPVPAEIVKDQRYAFIQRDAALMASRFKFAQHGQSGAELSEMLPHLGRRRGRARNHPLDVDHAVQPCACQIFMNTGSPQLGRPAMGAWVTYGLGTEVDDLPGFIVLHSGGGASGGAHNWGCGFMPTLYQGVPFRSQGDPVLDVSNPQGHRRAPPARQHRPHQRRSTSIASRCTATRRSPRASAPTRWPTACRRARRSSWTSRRRATIPWRCTARSAASPASRTTASSRVASSSAACAL